MNIVHILPESTALWEALMLAQREGLTLLTNGRRAILACGPVTGFTPMFAADKPQARECVR